MLETHTSLIDGRYRLVRRLRRGGMSEVFLAFDEQAQQQVALKLVCDDDPDCFKRLKRETGVLSRLSHEHILPILDYGEWDSYAYLVLPFIKFGNLRERLAKGALTQIETGVILSQVADALQCAHEHDLLHRDIKASNILLDSAQADCVYLADFGLARSPGGGSEITQTGCIIGTPEYMAPELVTMPESVSSDIYALGILLYQMLTGRLPFTGNTPIATCWKHVQEIPPLPSSLNPAIAPAIEAVVLRAIDKDPQRRFPGARSMAEAYEQALLDAPQMPAYIAAQLLPSARVTIRKLAQRPTMSIVRPRASMLGQRYTRSKSSKRLLSLVAVLWLATSIALVFVIGHSGTQASSVASVSVHSVGKSIQPVNPVKPRYPAQPAPPATAASVISTVSVVHPPPPGGSHKHHKHGHGGGGDGNNADGESSD